MLLGLGEGVTVVVSSFEEHTRLAESSSDDSGETPEPARETRALLGPMRRWKCIDSSAVMPL